MPRERIFNSLLGRSHIVNDNRLDYPESDRRHRRSALTRGRFYWYAPAHLHRGTETLNVQWHFNLKPQPLFNLSLQVNDDEHPLHAFFQTPFGSLSASLGYWAHKLWPISKMPHRYNSEREISFSYFEGVFRLHLWSDPNEWRSSDRWWQRREFHFEPMRFLFGKMLYATEVVRGPSTHYALFEHDDGDTEQYAVELSVKCATWKRDYWPWYPLSRSMLRAEINVVDPNGIPSPGKGENSWDCDDTATFSMSMPYRGSDDATLDAFIDSIKERRERYGGTDWKPAYLRVPTETRATSDN